MIRILTGDVGGTKTRLALYEGAGDAPLTLTRELEAKSASEPRLEPIVERFLAGQAIDAAGFGVAGPVANGMCRTTNLPWVVQLDALRAVCGTKRCVLRNDVEMAALGLPHIPEARKVWLQQGQPPEPSQPSVLVSVGTGFGRALLVSETHAFASEAGHASFAARHPRDERLREHLRQQHEHVSVEHVLSGPGLVALFDALIAMDGAPATHVSSELTETADRGARIGELGLAKADPVCAEAIHWFAELLGAELGNVALQSLPRGGLYLWGGVARKLKLALLGKNLLEAFRDKPRMREVLETIPLALIDDSDLALLGARAAAMRA